MKRLEFSKIKMDTNTTQEHDFIFEQELLDP